MSCRWCWIGMLGMVLGFWSVDADAQTSKPSQPRVVKQMKPTSRPAVRTKPARVQNQELQRKAGQGSPARVHRDGNEKPSSQPPVLRENQQRRDHAASKPITPKAVPSLAPKDAKPWVKLSDKPSSRSATQPTSRAAAKPPIRGTTKPTTRQASMKTPKAYASWRKKDGIPKDRLERLLVRVGQLMGTHLLEHAMEPDDPWLLVHCVMALGPNLRFANKKPVVHHIIENYVRSKMIRKFQLYYFPKKEKEKRIQSYEHMFLRILLQAGVPIDYTFRVKGKNVSLRDLYTSGLHLFPFQPTVKGMGEHVWLMSVIRNHMTKGLWGWRNAMGRDVNLFRAAVKTFYLVDRQTTFLRRFKDARRKVIPKKKLRRQFIYSEPYGGFPLMRAGFSWMTHPMFRKRLKRLYEAQLELLFYRFDGELRLYVQMFRKNQKNVGLLFVILLQQLQFSGQWLKTIALLAKESGFKPNAKQRRTIRQAIQLLCVSVMLLDRMKFYDRAHLLKLKKMNFQTRRFYYDLLGGTAHGLHALVMLQSTRHVYQR